MKSITKHLRSLHPHSHVPFRGSLFIAFVFFAFSYAAVLVLIPRTDTASAQYVPLTLPTESQPAEQPAQPTESTATGTGTSTPLAVQPAPSQPAPAPAPAPVYDMVTISSIGLSARYVSIGTTSGRAIDVHPTLIGWWTGSAMPGQPGAAFLDGHNPGVFSKLPNISVGATITLTKASGETFNYTVVFIETVQLDGIDMHKALSTYDGAPEGLNLMTCVGTYSAQTGTTDQRLVVYAVRS